LSKKGKPLVLLFDGNGLLRGAFHALPPVAVSKTGETVNAVYGFASTLLKVIAEFKPTYWAITFDCPAPKLELSAYSTDIEFPITHLLYAFPVPLFSVARLG